MEGVYTLHREFTPEQREEDQIYGIMDNQQRTLTLAPNHTFTYQYHYYYQYEGTGYVLITSISNDTELTGTYAKESNKITATITAGTQDAKDDVKKTTIFKGDKLSGKIELLQDGGVLKVLAVQLNPAELDRKNLILSPNMLFKQKK